MKRFSTLSILIIILATSCQTSSELGSNALIQKRRYTKGFNLNVKKPVITSQDERRVADNIDLAEVRASATKVPVEYPKHELKSDKENKSDLASDALSQSLIKDSKEVTAKNNEKVSASPTAINDAYPLHLRDRSRTNSDLAAASSFSAPAEATLLVIILTILIPPLGVALVYGISAEFWISLVLTLLFYIPGLIYSLIVIL